MDFTFSFEDKNIYKTLRAFNSGARADKTLGFRYKPDDSKEEVACLSVWNKYVPKLIWGEYDPDKYLPVINKGV